MFCRIPASLARMVETASPALLFVHIPTTTLNETVGPLYDKRCWKLESKNMKQDTCQGRNMDKNLITTSHRLKLTPTRLIISHIAEQWISSMIFACQSQRKYIKLCRNFAQQQELYSHQVLCTQPCPRCCLWEQKCVPGHLSV